jgi:hypothetical protein
VMVSTSHSEQPTWSFSLSAMFSAPGIESMGSFTQQLGLQQSLVWTTTFSTFPGINSQVQSLQHVRTKYLQACIGRRLETSLTASLITSSCRS